MWKEDCLILQMENVSILELLVYKEKRLKIFNLNAFLFCKCPEREEEPKPLPELKPSFLYSIG